MKSNIKDFQTYLKEIKKCSDNTFDAYISDVEHFLKYCAEKGIEDPNEFKSKDISEYLDYIVSIGKSASTKTRITASLRCYVKYLYNNGFISENCAQSIKNPRSVRSIPEVLTSNEVLSLLAQPSTTDFKGMRDKAMLELLYATGIKVTELIELNLNDINLQIGILHIKSEHHERIVPIYQTAVKHISEYINIARPVLISDANEKKLFSNYNGKPMSRQGFWKIIKYYSKKAGIDKDITPQTVRHSFAAHLLENGAELVDIKDMLGHTDISSTQVYTQIVKSKYLQSYTKFHPLAK